MNCTASGRPPARPWFPRSSSTARRRPPSPSPPTWRPPAFASRSPARGELVREAARCAPDVVVCHEVSPDETLFAAFALLAETAPCPVVVFTHDPEAAKTSARSPPASRPMSSTATRPSAFAPSSTSPGRAFEHERRLRENLADVTRRFDERKLVDRAKGT